MRGRRNSSGERLYPRWKLAKQDVGGQETLDRLPAFVDTMVRSKTDAMDGLTQ